MGMFSQSLILSQKLTIRISDVNQNQIKGSLTSITRISNRSHSSQTSV